MGVTLTIRYLIKLKLNVTFTIATQSFTTKPKCNLTSAIKLKMQILQFCNFKQKAASYFEMKVDI